MNLKSILKNIKIELSQGNLDKTISGISENSLEIKKDNLFFAVKGNILDGHKFIDDAISKGCTVVVCTDFPVELNDKITYIKVKNIRKSISIISLNFYNNPSDKIKVITVTGTNGKTSVVYFLYQIFRNMNLKVGMLGDLRYGRTVHSLSQALDRFKTRLYFISPESLAMPEHVTDDLTNEWSTHQSLEEILGELDVLYVTRIQKERFPDIEDYKRVAGAYRINSELLNGAKTKMRILHPLPRVDEISTDVDNTKHAAYFRQAFNGIPVRMALLEKLIGGK